MKLILSTLMYFIESRSPFPPVYFADDLSSLLDIDCTTVSGACTREFRPVCGNDGITRGNPCTFVTEYCTNNPNLEFQNFGLCVSPMQEIKKSGRRSPPKRCRRICPRIMNPVCGDDGLTYNSKCDLSVKNCNDGTDIKVASRGECPKCPAFCPRNWNPVCGSDGNTYGNNCALEMERCNNTNLHKKYHGACH